MGMTTSRTTADQHPHLPSSRRVSVRGWIVNLRISAKLTGGEWVRDLLARLIL